MLKVIMMLQQLKIEGRLLNYIVNNFLKEDIELLFSGEVLDLQFKYSDLFNDEDLMKFYNIDLLEETNNHVEKIIKESKENGIEIITFYDEIYPESLREIKNSPLIIYAKGNVELLKNSKAVGCVGTRKPSDFIIPIVENIVRELAKEEGVIVSGLAIGIDTISHNSALLNGAKTIAVLANGLDWIYPKENEKLAKEILRKDGLIISEYPIGSKINKTNFINRNRIVSGLSRGIIIFEAGENSGTMHTARFAVTQGKQLYCPITDEVSSGVKKLIETNSAKTFKRVSSIIDDLFQTEIKELKINLGKEDYEQLRYIAETKGETVEGLMKVILSKLFKGEMNL